jgi:hypothetical protein
MKNHLKDALDEKYSLMSCDPKNPASWKHKPPPHAIREPEPGTEPLEPFEPNP